MAVTEKKNADSITWSEEDKAFIAFLSWPGVYGHGDTPEAALAEAAIAAELVYEFIGRGF